MRTSILCRGCRSGRGLTTPPRPSPNSLWKQQWASIQPVATAAAAAIDAAAIGAAALLASPVSHS